MTKVESEVRDILSAHVRSDTLRFINELEVKGATANEFKFLDNLIKKYNIHLYTLEDAVRCNTYLKQKEHLWKLMTAAGIKDWDNFIRIESIDKFREIMPGITTPEYIYLVVLYTKERQSKGMYADAYWSSVINKVEGNI